MQVLIIEDVVEMRHRLSEIVELAFPEALITTAASPSSAYNPLFQAYDLVLVELGFPDGSGLDFIKHVKASGVSTICIVTTMIGDDASIVGALSAGADGYLLKEDPANILVQQLSQTLLGLPALSPSIARRIMEHFHRTVPTTDDKIYLTKRETQVLSLIAIGRRKVQIAKELGVAETTVASHVKLIYRKLGVSSRAQAAWYAIRMGLHRPL